MFIYLITNRVNGKVYVGQHAGTNLKRYLRADYTRSLKSKTNTRKPHLYNALRKYGESAFVIEPLIQLDLQDKSLTKLLTDRLETYFIKVMNSQDKALGYNVAAGGGGSFGYTREFTPEWRAKLAEAGRGRKHSEETKAKMSKAGTGIPKTKEHREKLSIAKLGKKMGTRTPEQRVNMSRAHKGHEVSPETREKIRQANLAFQERKRKMKLEGTA
jgi:group I intron endonuclease